MVYCRFREIQDDLKVICKKIIGESSSGILTPIPEKSINQNKKEVTEALCETCPIPAEICEFLEFSLVKSYPGYLLSWAKPKIMISHIACKKYAKKLDSIVACKDCKYFKNLT